MTALLHLASAASVSLLTSVWQSFVLTLSVWAALRVLPGISSAWRSRLWLAVFALVAALPFLPHTAHTRVSAPSSLSVLHLDARWALALLCAWAVSASWSALRLLRGAIELRHIVRRARPIAPPMALRSLLHGSKPVTLSVSAEIDVPSVAGFFGPRILLPVGLIESLPAEDLRHIVLHELEHLRRRDDWTNLLQKLALVLCPLNPVLLWLERRLCLERELACDDGVLRASNARAGSDTGVASGKAYATCLTNLAEQTMLRRGLALGHALVLGAWRRQSELTRRVHRILLGPPQPSGRGRAGATLGGITAACTLAALVLAHTPLTVSFDSAAEPAFAAATTPVGTGLTIPTPAHAILLRATMPLTPVPHLREANVRIGEAGLRRPQPPAPRHIRRRMLILRHRQQLRGLQPIPQMTLIGWHQDRIFATPAVYFIPAAADPTSIFTYAAVPVRNGWLVIQL